MTDCRRSCLVLSLCLGCASAAWVNTARAQVPPPAGPAPSAPPAEGQPPLPPLAPPPPPPASLEPPLAPPTPLAQPQPVPPPVPLSAPQAAAPAPSAPPPAAAAPAPASDKPWYDLFKLEGFADGYFSFNYNRPRPQAGSNTFRAYDNNNGFALAWVGVDVAHEIGPVGGTLSLRFGPAARVFAGPDADHGLENVRQAFGTWKPIKQLTLDFGKFDTIVGAEVADSHKNPNYTRGALYWLGQPLFHTGLRATWQPTDLLTFKIMVANGWNRTVDNNLGKTLGAQIGLTPSSKFGAAVTWLGGPEQDETISCGDGFAYDAATHGCVANAAATTGTYRNNGANQRWRHLIDLVLTASPTDALALSLNGDYAIEKILDATGAQKNARWMGAALAGRFAFSDTWAAALRGELFRDNDGLMTGAVDAQGSPADLKLYTGTLTLEAKPSEWMIVRLDNRVDVASQEVFRKEVNGGASKTQFTSLLGVVITAGHTWERGK
ncbi:MAG: porin [Deltaproteobacteria bacterium]|nr:porin [Deltaproteobacteria bacterium]